MIVLRRIGSKRRIHDIYQVSARATPRSRHAQVQSLSLATPGNLRSLQSADATSSPSPQMITGACSESIANKEFVSTFSGWHRTGAYADLLCQELAICVPGLVSEVVDQALCESADVRDDYSGTCYTLC